MTSTQPITPGQIRIGNAEREQMAERLARAHGLGQIELGEFDTRVQQAYDAKVQTELDALVVDLPVERPGRDRGRPGGRGGRPEGRGSDSRPGGHPHNEWRGGPGAHWRADGPAHWRGRPAQLRGGFPRVVWIVLAVMLALWVLGPVVGFLFRVLFTAMIIAGVVVLVGKVRDRRRQ